MKQNNMLGKDANGSYIVGIGPRICSFLLASMRYGNTLTITGFASIQILSKINLSIISQKMRLRNILNAIAKHRGSSLDPSNIN